MKTLNKITGNDLRKTLVAFCFFLITAQSSIAQETTPPSSTVPPPQRTLPYRGMIGTIDEKKQSFTLKNKSNKEVRHFQIDKKTRFESNGKTMKLKDLKPNMAVRGSCVKTGNRHFIARLVRWDAKKASTAANEPK